jgi:ribosomal protein S18 acetylase RimI-like enzyme
MPARTALTIRTFQPADEASVIALWRVCDLVRPQNDPKKHIARKCRADPSGFLVGERDGRIVATVMAGYEGHRGWINYLAVAAENRRRGLGRAMMEAAENFLRAAGCPKINLQVRRTNVAMMAFYDRLGFAVDDAVSMGKRLEHD